MADSAHFRLRWDQEDLILEERDEQGRYVERARPGIGALFNPVSITHPESRTLLVESMKRLRDDWFSGDHRLQLILTPPWGMAWLFEVGSLEGEELEDFIEWEVTQRIDESLDEYIYAWQRIGEKVHALIVRPQVLEFWVELADDLGIRLSAINLLTGVAKPDFEIKADLLKVYHAWVERRDQPDATNHYTLPEVEIEPGEEVAPAGRKETTPVMPPEETGPKEGEEQRPEEDITADEEPEAEAEEAEPEPESAAEREGEEPAPDEDQLREREAVPEAPEEPEKQAEPAREQEEEEAGEEDYFTGRRKSRKSIYILVPAAAVLVVILFFLGRALFVGKAPEEKPAAGAVDTVQAPVATPSPSVLLGIRELAANSGVSLPSLMLQGDRLRIVARVGPEKLENWLEELKQVDDIKIEGSEELVMEGPGAIIEAVLVHPDKVTMTSSHFVEIAEQMKLVPMRSSQVTLNEAQLTEFLRKLVDNRLRPYRLSVHQVGTDRYNLLAML